MTFQIRTEPRPNTLGLDETAYILDNGQGTGIEVWPAAGFNCYRWFLRQKNQSHEMLFSDGGLFHEPYPTRRGFPILFPFPNRIGDGRYSWLGLHYQLPLNCPRNHHAIHGFACRNPWRVVHQGEGPTAFLTGEFQPSIEAPESRSLWPADYRLQVTYTIAPDRLRVSANIENRGSTAMPFGLGYHPFFSVPFLGDPNPRVQVPARRYWELNDNLPTGRILPVDATRDLTAGKHFAQLNIDDVLTGLETRPEGDLVWLGSLQARHGSMKLLASPSFREMVVFTPPHRKALCLEPYTCTTNAINLRIPQAGLLTLEPGAQWTGLLEWIVGE